MSIRLAPLGVIVASLCTVSAASAASVLLGSFNFGSGSYAYANHTGGSTGTLVVLDANGKVSKTVQFADGTTVNAIPGDAAGDAIQFYGPSNRGSTLTFSFDSRGFSNINFSFAAVTAFTAGSSGFTSNQLFTSANGTTFPNIGMAFSPNAVTVAGVSPPPVLAFQTVAFDLTSVAGLNNNATAAIRITIDGGAGSTVLQLDNVQITGTPIALGAPTAVPLPPASLAGAALFGLRLMKRRRQR